MHWQNTGNVTRLQLSNEANLDKAAIKNSHRFNEYGMRTTLAKFSKINCKSELLDSGYFTGKDSGNRKHRPNTE